jgi:hypothetical protein
MDMQLQSLNDQITENVDRLFDSEVDHTETYNPPIGRFDDADGAELKSRLSKLAFSLSESDLKLFSVIIDVYVKLAPLKQSLDENGIRAVLFISLRKELEVQKISTSMLNPHRDFVWAIYSESQVFLNLLIPGLDLDASTSWL